MTVKYFLSKLLTKKNIILSSVYTPPDSSLKEFKNSLKSIFDNIRRKWRAYGLTVLRQLPFYKAGF